MSLENVNIKNMIIGATAVSLVVAVSLKLLEDILGISSDMRVIITSTLGTVAAVYFGRKKAEDP